ncbi:MAG: Fe-S cluster assembly protein SufD [Flavobacteriales bacterium]|jgi:Fe-S cluster assembly protein SufD|nr:Fe-S cluster assembly protein SufD [Flavobacteriales bacterium]
MTMTIAHPILENLKQSDINPELTNHALNIIEKSSFPTRKTEDWKYTRINKILKQEYIQKEVSNNFDTSEYIDKRLDAINVFVVNGHYSTSLSETNTIDGLFIEKIGKNNINYNTITNIEDNIFSAINTAYTSDGLSISVQKNTKIKQPIHIINILTEDHVFANPRTLIVVEQSSELEIIQTFIAPKAVNTFTNALTEIFVKENAKCTFTKIENEGTKSALISTEDVKQLNDSTFQINTITKRQDFVRNGLNIAVDGQNCSTYLNGAYAPINGEHVDNHTRVDHLQPNCMSSEIYKGVLNDKSTGVFNGKVIVHVDAQKIEAYQKNNNVLISDHATMNAKPELEIFADDVKCSHGTTTGQFDEEAIFYLQARGISKTTAKEMLIEAFMDEVFDEIDNEMIRDFVKTN